jgi:hypothetical protein
MRRTEPESSTFGTDGSSGTNRAFRPDPASLQLSADRVAHGIGEHGAKRRCRQDQRCRGAFFDHEAQEHARNRADAKRRDRLGKASNRSTRASMMFGQRPKAPGTCGHIASRTISHGWKIRRTPGRKLVGTARFELATPRPPGFRRLLTLSYSREYFGSDLTTQTAAQLVPCCEATIGWRSQRDG